TLYEKNIKFSYVYKGIKKYEKNKGNKRTMNIIKYPKIVTSILMVLSMFILVSCTNNQENIILSLSTYEEALEVGQTLQINHELKTGDKIINDTINWESTNEGVATIQTGLVRAISEGTTTIKATYQSVSQSVVITVTK